MAKTQERASEIKFEFLELVTPRGVHDLRELFVGLNIFEDLFNDHITMDILINDSLNLPYKAPILGEEYLNFRAYNKSIDGEGVDIAPGPMHSVSVSNRHITKDRQQLYFLHFTSEQDIINSNTSISRSFRGKKISDIVDTIIGDYLSYDNDIIIEETVGLENVVIPNWKPFDAIKGLSKRAINNYHYLS